MPRCWARAGALREQFHGVDRGIGNSDLDTAFFHGHDGRRRRFEVLLRAAEQALVGQRGEGLVVDALEHAPQFSQERMDRSHASMIRRLHDDVEGG